VSKFNINYRDCKYVGLLLNDDGTVTKMDSDITINYFNEIGGICKTVCSSIPLCYIALKTKYGAKLFDSPVTNWSLIDNKNNEYVCQIETALGGLYVRSSFRYQSVIELEINKALAIIGGQTSEFCKFLALNKVDRVFICYF